MRRVLKCAVAVLLVMSIAMSCVAVASAANNKYTYTNTTKRSYVKVGGKNIGSTFYYQLIQVKGSSAVKKKINKTLKADYSKFAKGWKDFKKICVNDYLHGTAYMKPENYRCTRNAKVTSNSKNIFSVRYISGWYAGGVSNTNEYGKVFSKKTGKQLYLSNFVKGSAYQINNKVRKAFLKKMNTTYSSYQDSQDIIMNHKIKDYPIYVTATRVYVCFETYELRLGNNHLVVSLKREDK